jgi:hypothetical protein
LSNGLSQKPIAETDEVVQVDAMVAGAVAVRSNAMNAESEATLPEIAAIDEEDQTVIVTVIDDVIEAVMVVENVDVILEVPLLADPDQDLEVVQPNRDHVADLKLLTLCF